MKRYLLFFLFLQLSICNPLAQSNQITILDKVVNSKILRVGTTGDYKPFTYLNDSKYEGVDIELAKNLAKTLGAEVKYVKTSWPTLMKDLEANKFDIAMGGISKKLQRQQVGLFSKGYFISGKTSISRCEDKDKYRNLTSIDLPHVKIIVNPGGTNQKFVNKHIKSAKILVHNDNNTIFEQIKNNKADIMITDSVEVLLQSNLNPDLCPTMRGETFDKFEKAYLIPRDLIWLEY
ncbi:MAG: transporter substrate-binding domain-containing protein, partial [Gammaproteobacteria bacterium]|nr:transporter substrate-binding domain-containing protein [Gammaproteobacteria bacterium]